MYEALRALRDAQLPAPLERYPESALNGDADDATRRELRASYNRALDAIGAAGVAELKRWPQRLKEITQAQYSYKVRDRIVKGDNYTESLSGNQIAKIAAPRTQAWGEILQFVPVLDRKSVV